MAVLRGQQAVEMLGDVVRSASSGAHSMAKAVPLPRSITPESRASGGAWSARRAPAKPLLPPLQRRKRVKQRNMRGQEIALGRKMGTPQAVEPRLFGRRQRGGDD
jgi:hypothetical protein